jgi:hypothetical protein
MAPHRIYESRCPVHGYIALNDCDRKILLHPFIQPGHYLAQAFFFNRLESRIFLRRTLRVLEDSKTARHGEYRTRRLVLEAWGRLTRSRRRLSPPTHSDGG